MLASISNAKSMSCQVIGIAYGPDVNGEDTWTRRTIYALDIAGAQSNVKAIWATLHSGGPMKVTGTRDSYKVYRGHKGKGRYCTFQSQPLPKIVHYLMMVDPKPENDYHIITSATSPTKERGLYDVLRLFTPLPVLEEWAEKLLELGRSAHLVGDLTTEGSIEWACRIEAIGWDEVIDKAARKGDIRID